MTCFSLSLTKYLANFIFKRVQQKAKHILFGNHMLLLNTEHIARAPQKSLANYSFASISLATLAHIYHQI